MEITHLTSFCLTCTRIAGSQKETDVWHKPRTSYKQFRHSESLLLVRVLGTFSKIKSPHASQRPTFQGIAVRPVVLTVFFTS